MMTRLRFRFAALLLCLAGCHSLSAQETPSENGSPISDDRPNILWIIADDLSPDLGCYDYEGVHTPNIDRLAAKGMRYTRAFSTAPVCSSSRSALITGVYQTSTGTHHHRTLDKAPLPDPVEPITELLRRAGYFVCNSNSSMTKAGKGDYNFKIGVPMYDGIDWAEKEDGRQEGQPFFAQVQVHEPHRNFVSAAGRSETDYSIPIYYPDHPIVEADWENYLASVEVLDRKVGRVLSRLEEEGLAENTVVFFFGDHGRPHYRDKQWLYDGGIGVPLIVRWPNRLAEGAVEDSMVSLIDVAAATLSIAGVEVPTWMDGRDMLGDDFAGREMIFAARDRMGSTLDRVRCVRTSRYKYIRNFYPDRPYSQHSGYKVLQYPGLTAARVLHQRGELTGPPAIFWSKSRPAEELYDLSVDPDELHNLADDDEHLATLERLRASLDSWMETTGDQGSVEESNLAQTIGASDQWYRQQMERRGFDVDYDPEAYLRWWEDQLGVAD